MVQHAAREAIPPKSPCKAPKVALFFCSANSTLAVALRNSGCEVETWDTKDGPEQNLLGPVLQQQCIERIEAAEFDFAFFSPECRSFSTDLAVQLRSLATRAQAWGKLPIPDEWRAYLERGNVQVRFVIRAIHACESRRIGFLVEHPASHREWPNDWPRFHDWPTIWEIAEMDDAIRTSNAIKRTLAQCNYGSVFRAYTTFAASSWLQSSLEVHLPKTLCVCIGKHKAIAKGLAPDGSSLSRRKELYPQPLAKGLAGVIVDGIALCTADPPTTASVVTYGSQIHVGSHRPHAVDGGSDGVAATEWAPSGSLRQLEPESFDVLWDEPFPDVNAVPTTLPDDVEMPEQPPPGPFNSEELIPDGLEHRVAEFGRKVSELIARATRGADGWRVARDLRPESIILSEQEALNPCGWGWTWLRQEDGLWHAITPSIYPEDPPLGGSPLKPFLRLAKKEGLPDFRLISWRKDGFPGSKGMKPHAQLAPPHVGALKFATQFIKLSERDIERGYVTSGHSFPDVWPCVVDPMNVVEQHGSFRLTIDKTIHLDGLDGFESYNEAIVLGEDEVGNPRVTLVRVWQFARGAAILVAATHFRCDSLPAHLRIKVAVLLAKLDIQAFFRQHNKQRKHWWQSGRLTVFGFGTDHFVNFGERDAPDNTGAMSNALVFFGRRELARLDAEYPTVNPVLQAWLAYRLQKAAENPSAHEFAFAILAFICCYVDDVGAAIFDDPLHRRDGSPLLDDSGMQMNRANLYFEAIGGVLREMYATPDDKLFGPRATLVFLGTGCDIPKFSRFIDPRKAKEYGDLIAEIQQAAAKRLLPNGSHIVSDRDKFDSLLHKLLHASDAAPLMRSHLFYLRQALRLSAPGKPLANLGGIPLGTSARAELEWCAHVLKTPHEFSVPLASRRSFPAASSPSTVIHYGDASREFDKMTGVMALTSGYGAWAVINEIFFFFYGTWKEWEARAFSINILELAVQNMGCFTFAAISRALGNPSTHVLTFGDNTCAEMVSERGRTQSPGMHYLNQQRQHELHSEQLHQKCNRVASVENDIADLLSRGDIEEALRFARDAGLEIREVQPNSAFRNLRDVPPTWV